MKKLFSLFLMLFILSGCEKTQVLICESIVNEDDLKTVQIYQMIYKGKKIKEAKITTSFKPANTSYYDMYADLMDEIFNNMKEAEGVNIKTNSNKPIYNVDITIDFEKVTKDTKIEELNLDMSKTNFNDTIDKLKKDMEADGLTCKIK